MKNYLFVLAIFCCAALTASAQNNRIWATYYGGGNDDYGYNVTTDASGNIYVVGQTESSGLATAGTHQTTLGGGQDAFIVKFNPAGVRIWATYYGGLTDDFANGVKTDAAGNVYITGYTTSSNGISTPGAFQTVFSGGVADAFLAKFDSSGTLLWGTYIGGTGFDMGTSVATMGGIVYVAGNTLSPDSIATGGAHQTIWGGGTDAFLMKFTSAGNIVWGTYYGGTDQDGAFGVATDASGNVFIGGFAGSTSGIALGGFQNTNGGGSSDAMLAKFNSAGILQWATYYGASGDDVGDAIATGPGGCVYLIGITNSTTGIASGGFQNTFGGNHDAFLVKFDAAGVRQWATYYGGADAEEGWGVAVDPWGNVFLTGDTYSTNFGNNISTPNGFQASRMGSENEFFVAFTASGTRVSATFFGQNHEEDSRVAIDNSGNIYTAGYTPGAAGIAYGGFQTTYGGGQWDAFLVKWTDAVPHEDVIVPNDTIPPTPSVVTTIPPKLYYTIALYNGGANAITNAAFRNFSPGSPLPTSGSSTITFSCSFSGTFIGSTSIPVTCTALGIMKVTYVNTSGHTRVYDTEMLQLDLSGGTLPSGVRLRESPTLASKGELLITDIGGGLYNLSSFFDVFTELSTDGGSSWQPDSNSPARMDLQDDSLPASIPTLSQWGLMSLSVLVVCFGLFFIKNRFA